MAGIIILGISYYNDDNSFKKGEELMKESRYEDAIISFSVFSKNSLFYQKAQTKIEESKRKILEKDLLEEAGARKEAENEAEKQAIKRSQAEAMAEQEKFEKELKQKQLSENEANERIMSADNDGDGLTYREELKLGTSDWNKDSDGDGIPDGEDLNPAGGGRYLAQNFKWEYNGVLWEWTYSINEDWYEYYKNKIRTPHGPDYVTTDDPFIKNIASKLKETAQKEGYHLSSFIISFIQGLPYIDDYYTNYDDYPKYPLETLVEKNGDCEDTSYLFASIISATNIGVALVQFYDHMGVAIKTSHLQSGYYYPIGDDWYYYYETTAEGWEVGELPSSYINQKTKIMVIGGGTYNVYPKYKKPCFLSSEFIGYYSDGKNYYSDNQCNNIVYCIPYEEFYWGILGEKFYWDNLCSQRVLSWCLKSTHYPGCFFNSIDRKIYIDNQCSIQRFMDTF